MIAPWTDSLQQCLQQLPFTPEPWLTEAYMLSHAFRERSDEIALKLLRQEQEPAFAEEVLRLEKEHVSCQAPLLRQIQILGDGIPWSFARVVVPEATYAAFQREFDTLGERLLGETLLYVRPDLRRSSFEYLAATPEMHIYQAAAAYLPNTLLPEVLWCRRSVFWMAEKPLLVSELFLPELNTRQCQESITSSRAPL